LPRDHLPTVYVCQLILSYRSFEPPWLALDASANRSLPGDARDGQSPGTLVEASGEPAFFTKLRKTNR
jgi:hypothetical protein